MTDSSHDLSRARRVAIAGGVGTVIEFYEFSVYATAAALVFSKTFFPSLGGVQGTVVAFATFGVAFIIRPVGAVLFGHFGDRLGRKNTLVWTLTIMGGATVAIGLLPSAATIGVAAPILLVLLRCVQGLAIGGEWAGASLMTAESAPPDKRGLFGMAPQLGPSVGFVLSSLTFLIVSLSITPAEFVSWGWRIPFIASAVLIAIGLVIRLRLEESPIFVNEQQSANTVRRLPLTELVTNQGRVLLLSVGGATAVFALFYVVVAYVPTYGTETLGFSRETVLTVNIVGAVVATVTVVVSAALSDRLGRKRTLIAGNVLCLVAAPLLFPILSSGSLIWYVFAVCLLQAAVGAAYGPLGAYLPELFATHYRYTGAGLAYSFATVLGAALTPMVAAYLIDEHGEGAVTAYLVAICLISVACLFASRETAHERIDNKEIVPETVTNQQVPTS
ncbi:metabolite-proton symporter [Rhodococcus erythropolis]|uniref:MFS transporter n=1 Tax=Rhodococcus erythropolis TaxID=1833 RepID=UPI0021680DFC|nr:MFS transporter [Rhodococcus erythropolis]MCS4255694.1 metabolite-proton symporter [Rhodococcus erythropolis]MCW2425207.1 metabolite-proton symporter [Rhodococcus erythropolis]